MLRNPKFSSEGIISDNFILFACDLADQAKLEGKLENFKFDPKKPTVILSECVMTYMQDTDSTNLIKYLAKKIDNAAFVVYEQICPSDAFG